MKLSEKYLQRITTITDFEELEKWLPIVGFEGLYEVSSLGRVKSFRCKKEKIIKLRLNEYGYMTVSFSIDKKTILKRVHQLVAIAFFNHKPCGMKLVVDHIDEDKTNNNVNNLRIVTNRLNSSGKLPHHSSRFVGVSWNKSRGKWDVQILVKKKKEYLGSFSNEIDASMAYQKRLNELID